MTPLWRTTQRPSLTHMSASTRIAFEGSFGSRRKKTWVSPSWITAERGMASAGPSAESVTQLLADADDDGNGEIDYAEFLIWYTGG